MRQRTRLAAGALAIATMGGLIAMASTAANAGPVDPITSRDGQDSGHCEIVLPGGLRAAVSTANGREVAQLVDPTAAIGGAFSINSGGHQTLIPAAALPELAAGRADVARYDTALLAERQCGLPAPASDGSPAAGGTGSPAAGSAAGGHPGGGSGHDSYQLARLGLRTLDAQGNPVSALTLLTNVDDQDLVRTTFAFGGSDTRLAVPTGHYAALTVLGSESTGGYWFVSNPEFTVTDGTNITLDARTATVVSTVPATPRPSTLESSGLGYARGDGTQSGDWFDYFNLSPMEIPFRVNPSKPVKHGKFAVNLQYELTSPADAAEPYQYHVNESFDHAPSAFPTRVDAANLATVRRDYGAPGTAQQAISVNIAEPRWNSSILGLRGFSMVPLGKSRTEYFSTAPDQVWRAVIDGDSAGRVEVINASQAYRAGEHRSESFHTGPVHPAVNTDPEGLGTYCPACGAKGSLQFNIYPYGDGVPGHVAGHGGPLPSEAETDTVELYRDGVLTAQGDQGLSGVIIPAASGRATYRLVDRVTRNISTLPLSTASETSWTFVTDPGHGGTLPNNWTCVDGTARCTPLPLLYAYYIADGDLLNRLTPGGHTLSLDVRHQEHASAPDVAGATVSVSYDDGATWTPATVTGTRGKYRAAFTVPAAASGGYAAIKVSGWDRAGNRIDQTVQRAYLIP